MSGPYLQHARRHGPNGSDPIADAPYIAGSVSGLTVSSTTSLANVSLDPGSISWGTNDGAATASDWFDLQQNGGSDYGIAVLQSGLYVLDCWALFDRATAPTAGTCGAIGATGGNTTIGGIDAAPFTQLLGGHYRAEPSRRAWLNETGSIPAYHFIQIAQNGGASISSVQVEFLVVRLSEANDGF